MADRSGASADDSVKDRASSEVIYLGEKQNLVPRGDQILPLNWTPAAVRKPRMRSMGPASRRRYRNNTATPPLIWFATSAM